MATAFSCAFSRFRKTVLKFNEAPCTRHCTGSNIRAGSRANGANQRTIAKSGSIGSPPRESADCSWKPTSGIECRKSLRGFWAPDPRKYEAVEPIAILVAREPGALSDGERNGCGAEVSHCRVRRGFGS